MDVPSVNPLTPQQIAALEAGDGIMFAQDPATQRTYVLIEQAESTIDDAYLREKLDEAQASIDRGDVADWNVDEVLAVVRQRIARGQ